MYENKTIAVFGVSADPSKYGYKIFKTLLDKGFRVFGINPKGGQVAGQTVFKELASLPVKPDVAIMVIPPAALFLPRWTPALRFLTPPPFTGKVKSFWAAP